VYTDKSEDTAGLKEFFRQFSFPGGIGSHCTPETPGSIHEGGELGYVLSHACGTAFDNPELIVAAVVGDGEAQTGPLATSWHISKFPNPIRDGAVLPILHLNGYKINNPALLAASATSKWRIFSGVTAGLRISWRVPTPTACIRRWRPRWSSASRTFVGFSRKHAGPGATRPR
jgi:phosphoketolase